MLSLFPTFVSSQEISKVQKVSVNIGSGVSVGANALRIIGAVDGNISYYGADGPVRSQTVIGDIAGTPAVGPAGNVFIGTYSGYFTGFSQDLEQQIWSFDAGSEIYGSAAASSGGTVFFGTGEGVLYALDSETGDEIWQFSTGSKIGSSPVIGPAGDVYFGTESGDLFGLDGGTGRVIFRYGSGGGVTSPALDWAGNIYFGTFGNEVISLDSAGEMRWRVSTDGVVTASPVITEDGSVVFTSFEPGTLYIVDDAGVEKFSGSLGASTYGSPALGMGNQIYVATVDGVVQSWRISEGALLKEDELFLDGPIYAPITIHESSILLIATQKGSVYEISLSSQDFSLPQWPMFGFSSLHQRAFPNIDGDRCPDATDMYPTDASRCFDQDGDGVADVEDPDRDGDGLANEFEVANGLDPDLFEEDADGDGYINNYELEQGLNPVENEFDDRPMEVVEAYGALSDAGEVVITDDGRFVVVEAGSGLTVFKRDAETGVLIEASGVSEYGLEVDRLYAVRTDLYGLVRKSVYSGYIFAEVREFRHYRVSEDGELSLVQALTMSPWENGMSMEPGVFYNGYSGAVSSFAVSPNGDHAYLGTGNRGIVIFDRDVETGSLTFREHYMNGGTSFGAGGGLVMTEDGTGLFAQFGSQLWLLERAPDGTLSSGRQLRTLSVATIHEGVTPDHIVFLGPEVWWTRRPIVEMNSDGEEVASILTGSLYGFSLPNPARKLVYHYNNRDLHAYFRTESGFELLSTLTRTENPELASWARAIVSPDGRHIYATSSTDNRLVVLTAGFKGVGHPDTDNDGVPDKDDAFPLDSSEWIDTDADGVGNNSDVFPDDPSEWADFDGDELVSVHKRRVFKVTHPAR